MIRVALLSALFAALALPPAFAQKKPGDSPLGKAPLDDPYTDKDEKVMAELGVVSYAPLTWADGLRTTDLEKVLGEGRILWLETPHFRIGSNFGACGAATDPKARKFINEEMAALMACAHAKFTGEVGVCLATSGPGAIHLLNGLYDAKLDHQPVLAIVGDASRRAIGGDYQQEVDLHSLFKDVAHHYVQTCMHPSQVRHLIDRGMRIARARRSTISPRSTISTGCNCGSGVMSMTNRPPPAG